MIDERPERSKAEFRALREMAGVTQSWLADELDVEVRSVKRWESEAAPQMAPAQAWDVLDGAMERQRAGIDEALEHIDRITATFGEPPESVMLPYWASAEEYAEHSTDAMLGVELTAESWRQANASNRALAAVLWVDGVAVEWVSGADNVTAYMED